MKRIAFSGSVEAACGGQKLYAMVFQHSMLKRGEETVLTFYTTNGENGTRKIECLMDDHKADPYDAVVVGGGPVIRVDDKDNGMAWMLPSAVASTEGIPVFWNAPGVPEALNDYERGAVERLLEQAVLPVLRDDGSAERLFGTEKEPVCPDPLLLLPQVCPQEKMAELRRLLHLDEKYVVLQAEHSLTDELHAAAEEIQKLGCMVVVLNGRNEAQKVYGSGMEPSAWNAEQLCAVLAGCTAYIGTGEVAVVACAYGRTVLIPEEATNAEGLCRMLGTLVERAPVADLAAKVAENMAGVEKNGDELSSRQKLVEQLYDRMVEKLRSIPERGATAQQLLVSLLENYSRLMQRERRAVNDTAELRNAVAAQGDYIKNLQHAYDQCDSMHKDYEASLKVYTDQVEQQYYRQKDRVYRLQAAIKRAEKERDEALEKAKDTPGSFFGFLKK